jgi:hypothetical protein
MDAIVGLKPARGESYAIGEDDLGSVPTLKTLQVPSQAGISTESDLDPSSSKSKDTGKDRAHLFQMVASMPAQGLEQSGVPRDHPDPAGWEWLRRPAAAPSLGVHPRMALQFPYQLGHPDLEASANVTKTGSDASDPEDARGRGGLGWLHRENRAGKAKRRGPKTAPF